jgi:hypothetical protein
MTNKNSGKREVLPLIASLATEVAEEGQDCRGYEVVAMKNEGQSERRVVAKIKWP